ncbi:MAG: hypothetical protein ACTHW4_11370 [Actinomycetales bacterium]
MSSAAPSLVLPPEAEPADPGTASHARAAGTAKGTGTGTGTGPGVPGRTSSVLVRQLPFLATAVVPWHLLSRWTVAVVPVADVVAIVVAASERRSIARLELMAAQSRLVEESLVQSRTQGRLLETVLNTVDVGVVVLGPDGRVTLINRLLHEDGAPVPALGETVTDKRSVERIHGRILGDDGRRWTTCPSRPPSSTRRRRTARMRSARWRLTP